MYPLINTKFGIPSTRPILVPRQRLIKRLNAGIHGKLTLISAPAGYGKTTLAAEWLREAQRSVTWLSLDEADNDPARFLRYFLASLQVIDKQAGKETGLLLQAPEPPAQEVLMTTLLNELAAISQPFVLAVDDYQIIQTMSIHQLLNFIVERQPGQMHLVLLTREDPHLPLPRLRARGQITEVRQVDLRFTAQESAEFLEDVMGLKISDSDIQALERRTEGWIAGLQLAALSMQGRDDLQEFVQEFSGSNRYVLDYLAQEVFEKQPNEVQDFLLKTSILDQVCASLSNAVTERPGSRTVLETLEQANLFITPLDQSRTWYRYHRLFRDLLRNRLRAQDESTLKVLHQRASSWYESNDLIPNAIQHALACADWERALKLFHSASNALIKQGETYTLLNWYNQIPNDLILGDAESCLEYGWILLLSGQFDHAQVYLSHAEGFDVDDPSYLGQLLNAQAYLARAQGDLRRMVALSQQALAVLPKEDLDARCIVSINLGIAYWHGGKMDAADHALTEVLESGRATGNLYAVSMALVFQAMVMAVRGKLREAHDRFQSIVQQESMPAFLRGAVYLYLNILNHEWNRLEQCGKCLQEAVKIIESIQNDELFVSFWMMTARLHMAVGDLAAAGQALDKAQQKALEGEFSVPAMPRLAAARVQYAIACHYLEAASVWAERLVDGFDWHTFYHFTNTTQALYLLSQNKPGEAAIHLDKCFERASQEGWGYGMVAIRALQALAAEEPEAALRYLKDALQWAQPEGYIRTFVDLGKGMEVLLQAAIRQRIMPEYAEKILSAMSDNTQKPILGQLTLVEPINPRELEVLRLMAAGYPNRQIAEELVISTGTVKTHVHNICGKLGTRNRTEAASRARELGLV